MKKDVKTVGVESSLKEAVVKMNKFHIGSVIVTDRQRKKPIGIVTERDILRLVELTPDSLIGKVGEVMSHPVITIEADSTIEEAADLMAKREIKRLPVIEDEKLVGVVTLSDIMRASPMLINVLTELIKSGKTT